LDFRASEEELKLGEFYFIVESSQLAIGTGSNSYSVIRGGDTPEEKEYLIDVLKSIPIQMFGSGATGMYHTTTLIPVREDADTPPEMWNYRGDLPDSFIQWADIDGVPLLWRIIRFTEQEISIQFEGLRLPDNSFPVENGIAFTSIWHDPYNDNSWINSQIRLKLIDFFINKLRIGLLTDQWLDRPWPCGLVKEETPTSLMTFLQQEGTRRTFDADGLQAPAFSPEPWGIVLPSMFLMASSNPLDYAYIAANDAQTIEAANSNFMSIGGGKSGTIWTNCPWNGWGGASWHINTTNGRLNHSTAINNYGIRPCISLRPDVLYDSGDGTLENPFILTRTLENLIKAHLANNDIHVTAEDKVRWDTASSGGIEEAPSDGTLYGRKNQTWTQAVEEGDMHSYVDTVVNQAIGSVLDGSF
jgi:hypothetical protein